MAATKTIKLKVIETSDVHGHFFPYDFMEKKAIKGTLVRANTYINKERAKYGDNLLLIDNGDILQGQPCVYWSNFVMPDDENLSATVINYMRYDAETVGNHDIEPGHAVYDKWIREVRCPLLGANIVKEEYKNGKADPKSIYSGIKPYSVHYKDGVKIVVIGMLTPAIPNWLSTNIWSGMRFEEMVSSAKYWMKKVQETEHPDIVIGLFHSGKEGGISTPEYDEDALIKVAKEVPGFDIVLFGHDHTRFHDIITNNAGQEVVCLDPANNALSIADVSIELKMKGKKVVDKYITGEIIHRRRDRHAP
jgi:2',3'-cyclic-nucleotide 2'-phosphodiesterase/3'-nucleotidase